MRSAELGRLGNACSVFVCLDCRHTKKGFGTCPLCGKEMEQMPQNFRAGKRDDEKYWAQSKQLFSKPAPKAKE
jgi:hypothetical protein